MRRHGPFIRLIGAKPLRLANNYDLDQHFALV
jgi:hypothetical protein